MGEWLEYLFRDTEEWIKLFGAHLDPDTLEALIDIRRRLHSLDSHAKNQPNDDSPRYPSWCQEGANQWQGILNRLDALLMRL